MTLFAFHLSPPDPSFFPAWLFCSLGVAAGSHFVRRVAALVPPPPLPPPPLYPLSHSSFAVDFFPFLPIRLLLHIIPLPSLTFAPHPSPPPPLFPPSGTHFPFLFFPYRFISLHRLRNDVSLTRRPPPSPDPPLWFFAPQLPPRLCGPMRTFLGRDYVLSNPSLPFPCP